MTAAEKEIAGNSYMTLALRYGYIELQDGLFLYSGKYLNGLGMTERETRKVACFGEEEFYFEKNKVITECYCPEHVIDCMEYEKEKEVNGFILPIEYEVKGCRW